MLPVAPHVEHEIPPYDMDALLIEVELLLEWYLPRLGIVVTDDARADFFGLWRDALQAVLDAPPTWMLRDYHSPNLLWLPDRKEIARLGMLDFQDAVMGPPAYDLASLLQDARVDVPEADGGRRCSAAMCGSAAPPTRLRSRHLHPQLRHDGGAARDARSSASSRASTCATASRNICVTSRGYRAICNARWRTPRSSR